MKSSTGYVILAVLLIALGVLLLMQNLGFLHFAWGLLWAALFGAGGIAFLAVFVSNSDNWWAVIPGFTLLGLATLISLGTLFPSLADDVGGTIFLGAIGLSFWVVYFVNRDNWWAVIPAGTLFTLALVAGLASSQLGVETGGIFFLGLAATFGLVYILPTPQGRMQWAIIPALILGAMGVFVLLAVGNLIGLIGPVALILGGIYLVFRTLRVS